MTPFLVGVLFLAVALHAGATESTDPKPPSGEVTAPQIDEVQVRESIKARGRSLLASVWAILRVPWGDPAETQTVVALLLLTAVLGVIFVLRSLPSRVVLLADSIVLYGRIFRRQLQRDDILGKIGPYYMHGGLRLHLIPRPDRGRMLNIPLVCAPDEAFRLWFETLPDAPMEDPFEPASPA